MVVAWTPILTYARRRAAFLDWIEEHTEPVAFFDDEDGDKIGLAFGSTNVRMVVSRSGVRLSSGEHDLDMEEHLDRPLQGVLEIMEPRTLTLRSTTALLSYGLGDGDYRASTSAFARRVTATSQAAVINGWQPSDAAILFDLFSATERVQAEFGVVTLDELQERLAVPGQGRLTSHIDVPDYETVKRATRDQPPLSVFVEATIRPLEQQHCDSSQSLWQTYRFNMEGLEQLADQLGSGVDASKEDA